MPKHPAHKAIEVYRRSKMGPDIPEDNEPCTSCNTPGVKRVKLADNRPADYCSTCNVVSPVRKV